MKLLRMRTAFILNVLFSICMYHNFVKKFLLFNKAKYKLKFYININMLINIFYKNNQKHFLVVKF